MINVHDLDKLYEKYGFEKKSSNSSSVVYSYTNGYFHNAEVVKLEEGYDASQLIKEYQNIGYSCKEAYYNTILEAHDQLFRGFFSVNMTRERLRSRYERFRENQSKRIAYDYNYISCPYFGGKDDSDCTITERMIQAINSKGPNLIVLEAAAGYGKTCTVYELLKEIIIKSDNDKIPIFTELSRNRTATIFKYVLLDEIDNNFHSLKSDLIISEIIAGRIPLIIDGFDELITKSSGLYNKTDKSHNIEAFEDVESMLDTIGDLLVGEAKIVLTSRKSAIFAGDKFEEWVKSRENIFNVERLVLGEPSIKDWLGLEKTEILKDRNIPLAKFLNPVLLAFLRTLSIEDFMSQCNDAEVVIQKYFSTLLEREKERQNIFFTVQEQMDIFKSLAGEMVEYNITSESREFIKEIILDKQKDLINNVRSRYPSGSRPDIEDIANTLAGHVLLDRIGMNNNTIGFVNDFVFGILIGESICDNSNEWCGDIKYIDLSCTAFSIRSQDMKNKLYSKFKPILEMLYAQEQIEIDIKLKSETTREYIQVALYSVHFKEFDIPKKFIECTFTQCVFTKMIIRKSSFYKCIFVECRFFDCEMINDINEDRELIFTNCIGEEFDNLMVSVGNVAQDEESYYEKIVLEQFWPKGRLYAQSNKEYRNLFSGINQRDHIRVTQAIDKLKRRKILLFDKENVSLNYELMSEIRHILGIDEVI